MDQRIYPSADSEGLKCSLGIDKEKFSTRNLGKQKQNSIPRNSQIKPNLFLIELQ
jgi:hypothetical protein